MCGATPMTSVQECISTAEVWGKVSMWAMLGNHAVQHWLHQSSTVSQRCWQQIHVGEVRLDGCESSCVCLWD